MTFPPPPHHHHHESSRKDDWAGAGGGGSAAEEADADAASDAGSEGSEGATDPDWLRVKEAACGDDGTILVTVSLPLPPVGLPGGKKRRASYLFQKQLEQILYGSSTSSGAVHRAIEVRTVLHRWKHACAQACSLPAGSVQPTQSHRPPP